MSELKRLLFVGLKLLYFFVEFFDFLLKGRNELFGLGEGIFFGGDFGIEFCVLCLEVIDGECHIGFELEKVILNFCFWTSDTLLATLSFGQLAL